MNGYPSAIRHFRDVAASASRHEATAAPTAAPVEAPERSKVNLWLPLSPLFLLLAPAVLLIALVLTPLAWLAPRRWRLAPLPFAVLFGRALMNLGGTDVRVDCRDADVRIRIY